LKNYKTEIEQYISQEISVLKTLDLNSINIVMNLLENARNNNANIYICGNGGSAATASHFVCDFNKGISINQDKKYNFVCLNDNVPTMMAIANDIGYDYIFKVPIENKIGVNDLFIGISGSGNSKNVLRAAEYAKECGTTVIGITGYNGGELKKISDYSLHVDVDNMQITEDVHMILDHLMMWIISNEGDK